MTTLKDNIIASHSTLKNKATTTNAINSIKDEAIKKFQELGFPTPKLEAWKYTSLEKVLENDLKVVATNQQEISFSEVQKYFVNNLDSYRIVFVDGKYNKNLSEFEDGKNGISLLSDIVNGKNENTTFNNHFNTIAKQDGFTALNTAFVHYGVFIHIAKSVTLDKPIQIVHFSTESDNTVLLQPRNLVVLEKNAHVKIIERHQSLSSKITLTNSVTEMYCDKDGTIDFYKIQNDATNASLVDNTYLNQKSNTECSVHTFTFGGNITRNNLNFYQNGEHMDSILKGVTILDKEQHVDHHTLVHHIEPNCESHQDYKGIYDDKSVGVFNGKVYVNKEAQKTDAYQQNDNVLLTNEATINAKPQLEIFADDVKCSHGCTIGQLDQSALFYMQQRGIPKKQAKGLLMFAFANSVLESVKVPELKELITKTIATKLGINLTL